jgi:hypothetical protein
MSTLGTNLGHEGKKALREYVDKSGIDKQGEAYNLFLTLLGSGQKTKADSHEPPNPNNQSTFNLCLKNWRQLTNSDGEIKLGPLLEGIAEAQWSNADCILSTEVGATASTKEVELHDFHVDHELSNKALPGQGVGAMFAQQWRGKWVTVDGSGAPTNSRIYLIEEAGKRILIGVFYAPPRWL